MLVNYLSVVVAVEPPPAVPVHAGDPGGGRVLAAPARAQVTSLQNDCEIIRALRWPRGSVVAGGRSAELEAVNVARLEPADFAVSGLSPATRDVSHLSQSHTSLTQMV